MQLKRLSQRAPNLRIFAMRREVRDVRESMETLSADPILRLREGGVDVAGGRLVVALT